MLKIVIKGPIKGVSVSREEIIRTVEFLEEISQYYKLKIPHTVTVKLASVKRINRLAKETVREYREGSNYLGLYPQIGNEDGYPTSSMFMICYNVRGLTPKWKLLKTICHEFFHMIGAINKDPDFGDECLANRWENKVYTLIEKRGIIND